VTDLAIRDERHYLATVAEVRALVERIETVEGARDLADYARAAQVWAQRAKLGTEQVNLAAAAKLWAERRAGELLREAPKNAGGLLRGSETRPRDNTPTLDDLGVTKHESSRWQQLAEIPEPDFAEAIDQASQNGTVTASAVRRMVVPISEELLAKQQRDTLIWHLERCVRGMESPPSAAVAECQRLLRDGGGDPGPFTPSRFERVAAYATAFANTLREAGIDG